MIEKLEDSLIGIVIGVRFRANFSVEDQIGRIVDDIIYAEDSFFGSNVFPYVQSNVGKKRLVNENTNDSLLVDNSNIILEINFGSTFKSSDANKIIDQFHNQIIKGIMKKFAIREIMRVGFVKRYIFKLEGLADRFVNKTIGKTLEGINDINLSFSKKIPVPEAFIKKNINDYDNAIFNVIKKSDLSEIFMSIDYQRYFDPFLESTTQENFSFKEFVNCAEQFNNGKYLPWLNSNYIEK